MTPPGHSIRLHGPWEPTAFIAQEPGLIADLSQSVASTSTNTLATRGSDCRACKLQIPQGWPEWWTNTGFAAVRLERRFGLPTGLDPDQEVWLVIEASQLAIAVGLNQVELGDLTIAQNRFECSVRTLLQPRNRLSLKIPAAFPESSIRNRAASGQIQEVRLEIR